MTLVAAEIKRTIGNQLAHPIQAALEVAGVGLAAALLPRGPGSQGVIAFAMSLVALTGVQAPCRLVREEAGSARLDMLRLSSAGLASVAGARCLAESLRLMCLLAVALAACRPRERLLASAIVALVTALPTSAGMLGVGLAIACPIFVARRGGLVSTVAGIAILSLSLVARPGSPVFLERAAQAIPLAHAMRTCGEAAIGVPWAALTANLPGLLLISSIWLAAGVAAFGAAERFARVRGWPNEL